jgi:molybdopterin-guanine dinucleotide biosynthesis protein B
LSTPVIGIAGWKNSGKTTLATRLIAEFTRRGFRVASVKHAHHEADIDREGTDTFRHRAAGAVEVALVTGRRWAIIHELGEDAEPSLDETLARLSPSDIAIVEGYKRADPENRSQEDGVPRRRTSGARRPDDHRRRRRSSIGGSGPAVVSTR